MDRVLNADSDLNIFIYNYNTVLVKNFTTFPLDFEGLLIPAESKAYIPLQIEQFHVTFDARVRVMVVIEQAPGMAYAYDLDYFEGVSIL